MPQDIPTNDQGRCPVHVLGTANISLVPGVSQLLEWGLYGFQLVSCVDLCGSSDIVDCDCIQPYPVAERLQGSESVFPMVTVAQFLVL